MVHYLDWDDNEGPLAYLITFRTYGTWLHGDKRLSVDRHSGKNLYGTPKIGPNENLVKVMRENRSSKEFLLNAAGRKAVDAAIRNVCKMRHYTLFATNVRSNHAHSVVFAQKLPELVMNAFKSNATRELRQKKLVPDGQQVWSRGGSTRYLWKPHHLAGAIDYVLYCQEDIPPDFL